MTDRLKGFVVVLETDIREDNAAEILTALRMIKGVQSVQPVMSNASDSITTSRMRMEFARQLSDMAQELLKNS